MKTVYYAPDQVLVKGLKAIVHKIFIVERYQMVQQTVLLLEMVSISIYTLQCNTPI